MRQAAVLLCASLLCALTQQAAGACEGNSCPEDQEKARRDHLLGAAVPTCPRVKKYPQDGSKLRPVSAEVLCGPDEASLRGTCGFACTFAQTVIVLAALSSRVILQPTTLCALRHCTVVHPRPNVSCPVGASGGAGGRPLVGGHSPGDRQGR